jgi:hypothetical protein
MGFPDGGQISIESEECKKTCTRHNCNSFTIEIDEAILDFGNDPWWIGIADNLQINDEDEMEIDWIDRIPWQYRDYQSLDNGAFSKVLPPYWSFDHVIDIKAGKEPLGDPSTLSQKKSYQYSKNTLKKCLIRETFAQASHQREYLSSSF